MKNLLTSLLIWTVFSIESVAQDARNIGYIKEVSKSQPDSVIVIYEQSYHKETSMPGLINYNNCVQKRSVLCSHEITKLSKLLSSKKSYSSEQVLLNSSDMFIFYYKKEEPEYRFHISSVTRSITAFHKDTVLHNRISEKFADFLIQLFIEKQLWNDSGLISDQPDKL